MYPKLLLGNGLMILLVADVPGERNPVTPITVFVKQSGDLMDVTAVRGLSHSLIDLEN
jgi:hypothetical protein